MGGPGGRTPGPLREHGSAEVTEPRDDNGDDLFAPAPIALKNRALQALGVIAVQSARLEWALVGLRSILDDGKSHQEQMSEGRAKEHVKAIRRHLTPFPDAGPVAETLRWAEDAQRLLTERGNVMHSGWVVDEATGMLESHHMRSGRRDPFSQAAIDSLAERLGIHVAVGPAYWAFAILAKDARRDED